VHNCVIYNALQKSQQSSEIVGLWGVPFAPGPHWGISVPRFPPFPRNFVLATPLLAVKTTIEQSTVGHS